MNCLFILLLFFERGCSENLFSVGLKGREFLFYPIPLWLIINKINMGYWKLQGLGKLLASYEIIGVIYYANIEGRRVCYRVKGRI